MKTNYFLSITSISGIILFLSLTTSAQLNNGGLPSGFGVDADTRANATKMGPSAGSNVYHDDWFGMEVPQGRHVIDTANKDYYRTLLQGNTNTSFQKNMSVPLFTRVNGRLWIAAKYGRDFTGWPANMSDPAAADSTAFIAAASNSDDPANWTGGSDAALADKDDLSDVYIHMRRNGNTVNDSLWLFAAMATKAAGDRHLDFELYKNAVSYNAATGAFSTGGPDLGHTQWLFDASGNITQTGDMIITLSHSATGAITFEIRIWVSDNTFSTVVPARFNFGSNFTGVTATPAFGYANLLSKSGGTAFGAAIGNRGTVTANDTIFNTPWGSRSVIGAANSWDDKYQSSQYLELGINLSRIGVDPALYTALGYAECEAQFRTVMFKSRTTSAFTSALKDFVGPMEFIQTPVLDHTITNDTLTCREPVGTIRVNSITTGGLYQWRMPSGSTVIATSLATNRVGTYVLEGAVASGCPITKSDIIEVISDSLLPVATAGVTINGSGQTELQGGDTTASNYNTPFGGSHGLTWSWTGPGGFSSTEQNPVIGSTDTGTYQLTVTEQRNGCRSTTNIHYSITLLASNKLMLTGKKSGHITTLKWSALSSDLLSIYIIEKRTYGNNYIRIATVRRAGLHAAKLSYEDHDYSYNDKSYRIKYISESGAIYYSNTITVTNNNLPQYQVKLAGTAEDKGVTLEIDSRTSHRGVIVIYNTNGAMVQKQEIFIPSGVHRFPIRKSMGQTNNTFLIVVYIDSQLAFTSKRFDF